MMSLFFAAPSSASEGIQIEIVKDSEGYVEVEDDGATWTVSYCSELPAKYDKLQVKSKGKWKKLKGYWDSTSTETFTCSTYPNRVSYSFTETSLGEKSYRLRFAKKGYTTSTVVSFTILVRQASESGEAYVGEPLGDSRYYQRCFNKKCSRGEVIRVFDDGTVHGWFGDYDAMCLSGVLVDGYLQIGDDYISYPDFSNYDFYQTSGTYDNLKISSTTKYKWSKAKSNLNAKKSKTLKKEFAECQATYGW